MSKASRSVGTCAEGKRLILQGLAVAVVGICAECGGPILKRGTVLAHSCTPFSKPQKKKK